jgi:hypothetical protein
VVEFISINCSLEPCVEISGSVRFQVDSVEECRVEGSLELFSELDIGGVVLCGGFLDDESGFLSAYFELVDELVRSRVSLLQGIQPFEGNLREVAGFVGLAEFFPKIFVLPEVRESIGVEFSSCDPGFGPEGGAVGEVSDEEQNSLFVGFDGFLMESQVTSDLEQEVLELVSISVESGGFISQIFGTGVGDGFIDGGSFGGCHSGRFRGRKRIRRRGSWGSCDEVVFRGKAILSLAEVGSGVVIGSTGTRLSGTEGDVAAYSAVFLFSKVENVGVFGSTDKVLMPIFFGIEFVLRGGGFVVREFFEGEKGSEWAGLVVARDSSLVGKDVMILGDGGVEDVGESGANGYVVVGLDRYEAIFLGCFFVFCAIGGESGLVCSMEAGGEGASNKA